MDKNAHRLITMATVSGTHGLKGALKLTADTESATIFGSGQRVTFTLLSGHQKKYTINEVKPLGRKSQLLFLDGIANREAAEALKGANVQIPRADLPELEDGSYYWCDLIGLEVIDARRGYLGRLSSILQTGANDVYVVKAGERETLVPVIKSVIKKVALKEGRIEVDLPDGL